MRLVVIMNKSLSERRFSKEMLLQVTTEHQQMALTEELQAVMQAERIVQELDRSADRVAVSGLHAPSSPGASPRISRQVKSRPGRKSKSAARTIWLK